jgi:DNA repair ATPase RecN
MLTPFLKYVSEGRVIRRHSDLERYTFPEVTERIYLSLLTLALLSQDDKTSPFAKAYAERTMAKGTFDQVRMINNDLANMLAIVSGDPEITKKLRNKNQAQAMRQRQPVPVMALRRYMRTWEDHYQYLTQLERALNITDANLRNLRRSIANYSRLDSKTRQNTAKKLLQYLGTKLAGTDLHRAAKEAL